jgi:hypothetical protein
VSLLPHIVEKYKDYDEIKRREFKWGLGWEWFYYNRPILGAFFGLVTYILILGGFLDANSLKGKDIILAIGLGWLVGYNVTDLTQKLEDVASAIFGYKRELTTFDKLIDLAHYKDDKKLK